MLLLAVGGLHLLPIILWETLSYINTNPNVYLFISEVLKLGIEIRGISLAVVLTTTFLVLRHVTHFYLLHKKLHRSDSGTYKLPNYCMWLQFSVLTVIQ